MLEYIGTQGLRVVGESFHKIKNIITFIKYSGLRRHNFKLIYLKLDYYLKILEYIGTEHIRY